LKDDPLKEELFHTINIPLEAPTDGLKTKESKQFGQKFMMKFLSNISLSLAGTQCHICSL